MTKELLLIAITESDLFKTIDSSEDFENFLLQRENPVGLAVMNNPEYQRFENKRRKLEGEILNLCADTETAKKKINKYGDAVDSQIAANEFIHYRTGFTEGIKFLVGILME
jgi:hypothetical protein